MMRTGRDSTQRREDAESQGFQATSVRLISWSCRRPCKSSTGRPRSGYILVFFAMILFGIMALAALVIDIGFARLTQRQMQTAVDTAALEGLRFRDDVPSGWQPGGQLHEQVADDIEAAGGSAPPTKPYNPNDSDWKVWIEHARRWGARNMILNTFDDKLDPSEPDILGIGAGPVVEFLDGSVGDPDLAASQTIDSVSLGIWRPNPQLNLLNATHGDFVAGNITWPLGDEPENYEISGFPPSPPATSPHPNASTANAILARLRRTNNFQLLDEDGNVSSRGPTIPYLFGRGSFLAVADPSAGYSPRHHGMTVRATAIADARPVVSVGMPVAFSLPGVASFVLSRSEGWGQLAVDTPVTWSLSGGIISNDVGSEAGRFFGVGSIESMPVSIGREVPVENSPIDGTYSGYVPIYDEVDSVNRVVAFGSATAQVSSAGTTVTITREPARIASTNVSAVMCYPRPPGMSVDEWRSVLDSIFPVDESIGDVLLAPVSAR